MKKYIFAYLIALIIYALLFEVIGIYLGEQVSKDGFIIPLIYLVVLIVWFTFPIWSLAVIVVFRKRALRPDLNN